jgi:CheY-like chemotaxis protein
MKQKTGKNERLRLRKIFNYLNFYFRLAAVDKSRSKGPYELIILDLDMPIMDGFEACKMIRSD